MCCSNRKPLLCQPTFQLTTKKKTDEVITPQKIVAPIENKIIESVSKPASTAGSKPTGSSAENSSSFSMKGMSLQSIAANLPPKLTPIESTTSAVEEKPTEYVAEKKSEEKKVEQKTETISTPKKQIYTPMEKFNAMVEQHPELKNLANEFNLEVDF